MIGVAIAAAHREIECSVVSALPLYIVLNAGSGNSETETTFRAISDVLTAAGRVQEIFRVDDPARLGEIAGQAVAKARQNNGIVVAAGGDGTLNTVAQATLGSGCQFGVIPQGTFNYFGRTHELRALTLFVSNNRLQLEQVGLNESEIVEAGKLVAIVLRPVSMLALLWLVARGAMGNLVGGHGVQHFPFSSVTVTPSSRRVRRLRVSTDGETAWMDTPIEFRVAPEPLLLLNPVDAVPETAT